MPEDARKLSKPRDPLLQEAEEPVEEPPDDEGPVRPVPEPAQEEDDPFVQARAKRPSAVAAERDVDVLLNQEDSEICQRLQNSLTLAAA